MTDNQDEIAHQITQQIREGAHHAGIRPDAYARAVLRAACAIADDNDLSMGSGWHEWVMLQIELIHSQMQAEQPSGGPSKL